VFAICLPLLKRKVRRGRHGCGILLVARSDSLGQRVLKPLFCLADNTKEDRIMGHNRVWGRD